MKKTILVVLGLILVVVGLVVYYVASNLDSIVKNIIEDQGSKTLGTTVSVGNVAISLGDGTVELTRLRIGNPGGFDSDYAMRLGRIAAGLDKGSLTTDVIRITNIDVNEAHVIAEQKDARINLKELLGNVESGSGSSDEETVSDDSSGKQLVIDRFVMTDPKLDLIGFGKENQSLSMGDVRINNIGDPSSGASAADIAKQLLTPILTEAIKQAVRGSLKERVSGETDKAGDRVRKKLSKLLGRDDDDDDGDDDGAE